jgi:hypothetical protein
MNYLTINKQSNLVTNVIASSFKPRNSKTICFIPVGDKVLDKFYSLTNKYSEFLLDVGELAKHSPSVLEALQGNRTVSQTAAKPMACTVRKPESK